MKRSEVSRHEIAVLQAMTSGTWRTSAEIAALAKVAPRTARAHALKLVRLGILDQAEVFPAHRYRLSEYAANRNSTYLDRLRHAAEAMNIKLNL